MSFFSIRRRGGVSGSNLVIPYTQTPTSFVWSKAPNTVNISAIGLTDTVLAVVLDQFGVPMITQPSISYTSGTTSHLTIAGNVLTSVANGTSLITGITSGFSNVTGTSTVTQVVASITGVSSTLNTDDASSGTFAPVAKDSTNHTITGKTFTYLSHNPSYITVNSSGNWAGQSAGLTTIDITCDTIVFHVNVTVTHATAPPVATTLVWLDPAPTINTIGGTATVRAQINDQYGVPMASQAGITETSGTPSVATISGTTVTAVSNGSSIISAAYAGVTTIHITATVSAAYTPVATSVIITTGSTFACSTTGSRQLTAVTLDQYSNPMSGRSYTWSETDGTGHATVNSTGLVSGSSSGYCIIHVTDTGASINGSTRFTIGSQVMEYVFLTPDTLDLAIGDTAQLVAESYDQNMTPMPQNTAYTWTSETPGVATVSSSGLVTGIADGACSIYGADNTNTNVYGICVTGVDFYSLPYSILMSPGAYPIQLAITNAGSDVTNDSNTVYSLDTLSLGTIDAPTLGSVSPPTIVQGTSGSYSIAGTNIRSGYTLIGLPSGVTASSYTYTSTLLSFTLTATGSATTGAASLQLNDTVHGVSNATTLTVNTPAPVVPAIVQSKILAFSATTSASVTMTGNVVAGNYIWVAGNTDGGTITISSSIAGDTVPAVHAADSVIGPTQMFMGKIGATGPLTITVNISSSNAGQFCIHEITGIAATSPIDVYGAHDSNIDATKETASLVTTVDNDFIMMIAMGSSGYLTPVTGNGTNLNQTGNSRYVDSAYYQAGTAASGPYQLLWTGTSTYFAILAVALKPA